MTDGDDGGSGGVDFSLQFNPQASFFTGVPVGSKLWERLEALTRNAEMSESLRAEIRDPAWMLGRQWQVGEFTLEDAGSPVDAELRVEHDEVSRLRLGRGEPVDYDPTTDGPLETLVEREAVASEQVHETDDTPNTRLRAEAGQYFLRLLAERGVLPDDGDPYTAADIPDTRDGTDDARSLHLRQPDGDLDAESQRYVSVMAGDDDELRMLDGTEVFRRLQPAIEHGWDHADDPPVPRDVDPEDDAFQDAAAAYHDWYRDLYDEPTDELESAWDPQRFEYDFAVSTGGTAPETTLEADEYPGGRLDWDAFTVADGSLDAPDDDAYTTGTWLQMLPTPIKFRGMPAPRWWEFEDSSVNLEELSAAPEGLPRLLMLEFSMLYGNDWFTIPVDETPVGTLSRVTSLTITDSFGVKIGDGTERGSVPVAAADDWNMFMVDLGGPDASEPPEKGLFLPPTLADVEESDPVERLLLARDEMANLGFAVERRVEGPAGLTMDREAHHTPRLAVQSIRPAEEPAQEYIVVENVGSTDLEAANWSIEAHPADEEAIGPTEAYTFEERSIPPGASVTLGSGTPPSTTDDGGDEADLYLGRETSVWADVVHVVIKDPDGGVVERVRVPPTDGSLLPAYRLATDVPDNWFPLKPTGPDPDTGGSYRFRLAKLLDIDALGPDISDIPEPDGEILERNWEDQIAIYEEEVTRAGVELTRSYQLASWLDASTYLWSGRRAGTGRGEGRSGLQFDVLEE